MSEIWEHLLARTSCPPRLAGQPHALRRPGRPGEADATRTSAHALELLTRFQERIDVILGLNLKEAVEVAERAGPARGGRPRGGDRDARVGDPRRPGPRLRRDPPAGGPPRRRRRRRRPGSPARSSQQPRISTGAGDHFNAGFCLGRILGLDLEESLCAGVACSGYYVRSGQSPSAAQLAEFVAELPPPEG